MSLMELREKYKNYLITRLKEEGTIDFIVEEALDRLFDELIREHGR